MLADRGGLGSDGSAALAAAAVVVALVAARTPLDLSTALFATGPGGASDRAVPAVPFGVDPALVAGLQVLRQQLVFVLVPALSAWSLRQSGTTSGAECAEGVVSTT